MTDEYVTVEATLRAVSPDAVLLETEDMEGWVPRSCLHGADDIALRAMTIGSEHGFQIRQWFAKKKGFV